MTTGWKSGKLDTQVLTNRYRLLGSLGAGGMGVVYRAVDRLTGETVALKRLVKHPLHLSPTADLRLALTREFQVLAGLRHPHVIAVRDYGFDQAGQPFFSMDLLPSAATLLEAGRLQTSSSKGKLLIQLLAALVYVHRRHLVHRDLKPGNILVVGRTVKMLDFGLATFTGQPVASAGTLAYMAPEVLRGAQATASADLYAVGVLAYELFAGWHPFADLHSDLRTAILEHEPDFAYVDLQPPLVAVVQRLLAKDPADRYPDAASALTALAAASDQPLTYETTATRESFLQAATLVGRGREVEHFTRLLTQAQQGQGSCWLVGGESGIGKSRLLQEVRTHALVQGFFVLRGQVSSAGGGPYYLWRESLRHLALLTAPSDLEAAILQPLVPDMAELLERPIPPAPVVDAQTAQTRLEGTVADLLRRGAQQQPLLLLLEDLHWADDNSLEILRWLNQQVVNTPMLILATYRQDETPHLPEQVPEAQQFRLGRLAPDQIAALSEAMLGVAGRRPQLLTFLQHETEGNTFFMVEVMRALAEEVGQLDQIGQMTLPLHVFAGGIAQVVQRRLQLVPAAHQPLLQLAAVAGRQLDLWLLRHLDVQIDLEQWLTDCANLVVIERMDDGLRWQFSHDKLREGLLGEMAAPRRRAQHEQVAEGLAQIYSANLAPHYADLAYHYGQADLHLQERYYLKLAAEAAQATYANAAALDYYQRLLALQGNATEQMHVLRAVANILRLVGRWEESEQHCRRGLALAEQNANHTAAARFLRTLGVLQRERSDYQAALASLTRARALFAQLGNPVEVCEVINDMGGVYYRQGDYPQAEAYFAEMLHLAEGFNSQKYIGYALNNLGNVKSDQGDYATAQTYYEQSKAIDEVIDDKQGVARTLVNLGIIASSRAQVARAITLYEESLALHREIGDQPGVALSLGYLGLAVKEEGDFARAIALNQESLALRRSNGDQLGMGYNLHNLGVIAYAQQDYRHAHHLLSESLTLRRAIGDRFGIASTLNYLGCVAVADQEVVTAEAYLRESLHLLRTIGDRQQIAYALTGMAAIASHGAATQRRAATLLALVAAILTENTLVLESEMQVLYDQTLCQVRARAAETNFANFWAEGQTLSIEQAIDFALAGMYTDEYY